MRPARRRHQRSIRGLLALIFIVPLASLLALWGFAASVTLSNALQEHNFSAENRLYGGPAQALGKQLALERLDVFTWLSTRRHTPAGPLRKQFQATDAAATAFENGIKADPGLIPSGSRRALHHLESELAWLTPLRKAILAGTLSRLAAFQDYNAVIDSQFDLYSRLILVNNVSLYMQAAASLQAGRGLEMADRALTLISGALKSGGRLSRAERILFVKTVASQRLLMADALGELEPRLASGYQRADSSAAYKSFSAMENQVINSVGSRKPISVSPLVFASVVTPLFQGDYQAAEAQDRLALTRQGTQVGDRSLVELGLAGGLGLVAVVLSVLLMVRFGRRISRDLTVLQRAALDLAEDKLPQVVERLGRGEDVDVAAEAAPPPPGTIAETARVAEAFSSVQRTAVEAAVGQARLRRGVSQVFHRLAGRSQSLLHRQLTLLEVMERKTSEPDTLAELFQLDHLTTRMRRHAEGLIILAGSAPARGWRSPVPIIDVLRGARAEVEDYTRVNVISDSEDSVIGTAVADVIHLLAELIENATAYSPASAEVAVRAGRVAKGIAVEVEDRGVGITEDELETVNERLASPPEFDLAASEQLGLFVVSRLAARHKIKVTLRLSPFGGTQAIVLLPHTVLVAGDVAGADAGGHGHQDRLVPSAASLRHRADSGGRAVGGANGLARPAADADRYRNNDDDHRSGERDQPERDAAGALPAAALKDGLPTPAAEERVLTPWEQLAVSQADAAAVGESATTVGDSAAPSEPTAARGRGFGSSLQFGWRLARSDAAAIDDVWATSAAKGSDGQEALTADRENEDSSNDPR